MFTRNILSIGDVWQWRQELINSWTENVSFNVSNTHWVYTAPEWIASWDVQRHWHTVHKVHCVIIIAANWWAAQGKALVVARQRDGAELNTDHCITLCTTVCWRGTGGRVWLDHSALMAVSIVSVHMQVWTQPTHKAPTDWRTRGNICWRPFFPVLTLYCHTCHPPVLNV